MLARPFRFIRKLSRAGRPRDDRRKKLGRLEQSIGYYFKDIKLLETALSHLSYVNETGLNYNDSNERLEFLGDAVLDLIASEYLYRRFRTAREGELTRIKSSIVSRSALARKAARLELEEYLICSKESFPSLKRGKKTIISNSLEAIIGAIYLDGGLPAAKTFVYDKLLDGGKAELSFDSLQEAKNSLLHLSQVKYNCQPSYRIVEVSGPEHAKQFVCEVTISGKILGRGAGSNKKESEKKAAVQALEYLADSELQPNESG
jgi:ribonuclease-3